MYLRIRYKIHVFGFMSQHLCISRVLCKIHVNVSGFMSQHLYISGSSASPCLRIHVSDSGLSIHMYLRNLCKIHVSRSVYKHPYISQDPLQDPCLRFMSQHLYTSGSSARSMSSDSCLSIHMYLRNLCKIHSGSVYKHSYVSQGSLQDPCLRIRI